MALTVQHLLDTTPRWLSLTLVSSSSALIASGIGVFLNLIDLYNITPFTLLLHFVWAITLSAWITNLRIKTAPEKKSLIAIGVVLAVGSAWSSIQQWIAYLQTGLVNDLTLVAGAMLMDVAGCSVTYILYHLNILRK